MKNPIATKKGIVIDIHAEDAIAFSTSFIAASTAVVASKRFDVYAV